MNELHDYLFEDLDSGEEFLVQEINKTAAIEVAKSYFGDAIKYYRMISPFEAEMLGYDTY